MKFWLLAIVLLLAGCGGSLSDEQRRKLRDRMKGDEIKRITEGELMAAAFDYGREIGDIVEKRDPTMVNPKFIDSLELVYDVEISAIQPGDSMLLGIESKLIEAYAAGAGQPIADDVQKLGTDSILYTKPVMQERPDGSVEFMRALSIHMPVRTVVLSIKE
ncbi:MAG TPA: hypothetical protein VF473_10285 [Cyclobacteriaceae bacterium]